MTKNISPPIQGDRQSKRNTNGLPNLSTIRTAGSAPVTYRSTRNTASHRSGQASPLAENQTLIVRIQTFGKFVIEVEGRPIEFSRKVQRRPLAFLKVLVAFGGIDVPKTYLSDVLWPDADGDLAHQSFATTLHRLRKLLECERALVLKDGKVSLNQEICWIDVWEFEDYYGKTRKMRVSKKGKYVQEQCNWYLNLYRGAFLADDGEAEWTYHLRERLRGFFIRECCRLADESSLCSQHEVATWLLEQAIEREPLAEPLYHMLANILRERKRDHEAQSVEEQYRRITHHLVERKISSPLPSLASSPLQMC